MSENVNNDEIKRLNLDEFELKKLVFVHRHGERTPIGGVFDSHSPLKWNVCDKVSKQSLVFTTADDKLAYKSNIVAPSPRDELAGTKVFQAPSQQEANHCQPGQLTDVGAETTFKVCLFYF